MTSRSDAAVLEQLADTIAGLREDRPVLVAIDGVDGAGKTTFADALVRYLVKRRRTVIRASIDGFHQPQTARYRRGIDSPEGFYRDSFDYDRLRTLLLDPLGPWGNRRYCTAAFDWRTNSSIEPVERDARTDALLIFDGIFSQRPELAGVWDLVVFLDVDFDEALRRSLVRDRRDDQSAVELERRFWMRYVGGQRLYFDEANPRGRADIVIDNNDPANPRIIRTGNRALATNKRVMVDLPRRPIASRERGWAQAAARALIAANVSPNAISILGLLFGIGAGFALWSTGLTDGIARIGGFVAAAALIQLRLLCNMFDGMVAVGSGRQTRVGELFNDLPDRFADVAILLGAGYSLTAFPWGAAAGWSASILAVLTAYVRLLGGSMGLRQYFGGPMAKPQRMAVMTVASVLSTLEPLVHWRGQVMAFALITIAVGSAITFVLRTMRIVRASSP